MEDLEILITRDDSADAVPTYAHAGDAGADLHAGEAAVLEPGERVLLGTGIHLALPQGHVAYVMPRSGLAVKHGVTVINAPGVVDAGYRGEIKVGLVNLSSERYDIAAGDRIAQLVVQRVEHAKFVEVTELPGSDRGTGGFGSSGFGRATEKVES